MWEPPAPAGIGMFLTRDGQRPICGMAVIPTEVIEQLLPRKQQIGQAEALACPLALSTSPKPAVVGK